MKRIAMIGAGGINSWALKHLAEVVKLFEKDKLIYVKIFDEDIVEEKNLLRQNQNFLVEDLMRHKAECLANRYSFDFENVFITEENINKLDNFTDIIIGVDNHKTRRLLYKYAHDKDKYLLDLRANGTQMAYFIIDKKQDWEKIDKTHFNDKELMERKGGCQLESDIQEDHIENGNKIMAHMGIYGIYLKRIRGEEPNAKEFRFAY